jgi:hypothetical protein
MGAPQAVFALSSIYYCPENQVAESLLQAAGPLSPTRPPRGGRAISNVTLLTASEQICSRERIKSTAETGLSPFSVRSNAMRDNGTIIDAVGLVSSDLRENGDNQAQRQQTASGIVEAGIKVLGTLLVLYRHYVPKSDYYEVNHTSGS